MAHSQNKIGGTAVIEEHGASPFVVGAGNANTLRRYSMTNRFMMSVAAVALIAGAGFANAQGTGNRQLPSAGSTAQQSAPSSERGISAAQSKPSSDMKATQSDEKAAQPNDAKSKRAQDDMKAGQKGEKSAQEKSAQDNMKSEKSKGMSSETKTNEKGPAAKDMKAEGRANKMNSQQKGAADSKV